MNRTYSVDNDFHFNDGRETSAVNKKLSFSESSSEEEENLSSTKPGIRILPRKLTFSDMVVSAVKNNDDPKGASLPSIKNYLKEQYQIDESKLKRYLKQSMQKCLETDKIIRCHAKSKKLTTGINGRFKISTTNQKKELKDVGKMKLKKAKPKSSTLTTVKVNKSNLRSLQQKSSKLQRAQQLVKEARRQSLNAIPRQKVTVKPRTARSKILMKQQDPKSTIVEVKEKKTREFKKRSAESSKSAKPATASTKPAKKKVAKTNPARKVARSRFQTNGTAKTKSKSNRK